MSLNTVCVHLLTTSEYKNDVCDKSSYEKYLNVFIIPCYKRKYQAGETSTLARTETSGGH